MVSDMHHSMEVQISSSRAPTSMRTHRATVFTCGLRSSTPQCRHPSWQKTMPSSHSLCLDRSLTDFPLFMFSSAPHRMCLTHSVPWHSICRWRLQEQKTSSTCNVVLRANARLSIRNHTLRGSSIYHLLYSTTSQWLNYGLILNPWVMSSMTWLKSKELSSMLKSLVQNSISKIKLMSSLHSVAGEITE